MQDASNNPAPAPLKIPPGLTDTNEAFPAFFLDTAGIDLSRPGSIEPVNSALFELLCRAHGSPVSGQGLVKVHVGEPNCTTRMRPAFTRSSTRFLRHRGAGAVAAGDTTVAYTGPRGHAMNPAGSVGAYASLAARHGWSPDGPAGIPFVVLDRPCSAIPSQFEFSRDQEYIIIEGIERFRDFFPAGGFLAADFVANHAHLTLHGLAGVAGCVKSIAMGCSGLSGKLRMHKSLLPFIDSTACIRCGLCVTKCPEQALAAPAEDESPRVEAKRCIGCGECVSVCRQKAVTLKGKEIEDWKLGEETLPVRMADYTLGLMNGRWESTVHVLHLYAVTELCDCVDMKQKPLTGDLGFLVGKNPFALDRLAGRMLARSLEKAHVDIEASKLASADAIAAYVEKSYGIITDVPLHTVEVNF